MPASTNRNSSEPSTSAPPTSWPLERILFALAGTMTLLSALLAAFGQPLVPAPHRVRRHQPMALRAIRELPRLARPRTIRHLPNMPLVIGVIPEEQRAAVLSSLLLLVEAMHEQS